MARHGGMGNCCMWVLGLPATVTGWLAYRKENGIEMEQAKEPKNPAEGKW